MISKFEMKDPAKAKKIYLIEIHKDKDKGKTCLSQYNYGVTKV